MDEWDVSDHGTAEADSGGRLSELPDALLLSILSLLDMTDVVRTTLLSKRWKSLWPTIPCLDFSDKTPTIVSGALAQWRGAKILKFRFTFCDIFTCTSGDIDSWLFLAIEKQVEELNLDLSCWRDAKQVEELDLDLSRPRHVTRELVDGYCLPQRLYSCSSITRLSLFDCTLRIEGNVQWNRLKSLTIKAVTSLSGDAVNRVLSGAPLLEELIICGVETVDDLNIRSSSLKTLKIGTDYGWPENTVMNAVRIWAPNLENLELLCLFYGTCFLDVPSLTTAVLCFTHDGRDKETRFRLFDGVLRSICHVQKVTLSDWCIQLFVELKEKDVVLPLSNSKFLELNNVYADEMLELVGVIFPKVETLIVRQDDHGPFTTSYEEAEAALVDACSSLASQMALPSPSLLHLKTFEATWARRDPLIIPGIEILLGNARVLEKMVIRLRWPRFQPETFVCAREKVLSMPRSSPTAQVMVVRLC